MTVYGEAWLVDSLLGFLDEKTLAQVLKTDQAESLLRYLAYWAHLHSSGNSAEAEKMLWNLPGSVAHRVIPRWLQRSATTEARSGRRRKRGLIVTSEQFTESGRLDFGQADFDFYADHGHSNEGNVMSWPESHEYHSSWFGYGF